MTESHFISHYCERTSTGLWGEPINALTNLAFLAAGILALRLYRRQWQSTDKRDVDLVILIILLFCIATGSTLWHIIAQPWAELADSIPILLFISVYLVSSLWRLLRLGPALITIIFVLFQMVNNAVIFLLPKELLNGSLFYVPTWVTLVIFTVVLFRVHHPAARYFVMATLLFSAALVLRTLDHAVCTSFPIGTHFIWHLLIALMLYTVFIPLIRFPVVHTSNAPSPDR